MTILLALIQHPSRADGAYDSVLGLWMPGEVREVQSKVGNQILEDWPGSSRVVPMTRDELGPRVHHRRVDPPPESSHREPWWPADSTADFLRVR